MAAPVEPAALLDEARAGFIQRFVSINVAARDRGNRPSVARACGCRVAPDRRRVTVFLSEARAATVLDHLRQTAAIAVVFSQPSSHQTVQLKGTDARIGPVQDTDRALIQAYIASFAEELGGIGFSTAFAEAVAPGADADLVGVTFTPTSAFDQTPGRNAGKPLA